MKISWIQRWIVEIVAEFSKKRWIPKKWIDNSWLGPKGLKLTLQITKQTKWQHLPSQKLLSVNESCNRIRNSWVVHWVLRNFVVNIFYSNGFLHNNFQLCFPSKTSLLMYCEKCHMIGQGLITIILSKNRKTIEINCSIVRSIFKYR